MPFVEPEDLSGGGASEPEGREGEALCPAPVRPGALSALLQDLVGRAAESRGSSWDGALVAGAVVGRFELVREVGRGGFGVVWEARDRELKRAVAFKALRAHGPLDVREERLLREAEAAARLSHPNIVALHDVGRSEHGPYLVLELLRGETLAKRLERGPVPAREAVRIALEVAKGLAHAHAQGVVHRDLTPGNVFMCRDGQVKVLDLGMAHAFGRRKPEGGTPGYMAPEQVEGAPEDERTDVFALGVMLYEALGGERPYTETRGKPWRPPAELDLPDVPGLGNLVRRMLAVRPTERPRDAGEVLAALSAIQEELEHAAPGVPLVRRHRRAPARLAALVVAALLAAAAVVAGARWVMVRHVALEASPSIAVLPFADLSPEHDQEYFADGVAEEILNALAQVENIRVSGRTSSFSFKGKPAALPEIGRALNVASVLEGSVRKAGGRVRITAQLVNAADGFRLWSQTFDRDLTDVFAVQEEIARSVIEALRVKLLPGKTPATIAGRTGNPEAYNQYLLGREFMKRLSTDGHRRALAAYQKAVALDPGYAAAWAGVSSAAELVEAIEGEEKGPAASAERRQRAIAAAERAIALAPGLAAGYAARSKVRGMLMLDFDGALADSERALALSPNDSGAALAHAEALATVGRLSEAVAIAARVGELDPLQSAAWTHLGCWYLKLGQRERARQALDRALEIAPENTFAPGCIFRDLLLSGRREEAFALARGLPEEWERLTYTAVAEHSMGHAEKSQAALDALIARDARDAAFQIAEVHAWRGEPDRAFEWLERARAQRDPGLSETKLEPLLRSLGDDPRWKPFLRKLNVPLG